jgi:hypothetical protein
VVDDFNDPKFLSRHSHSMRPIRARQDMLREQDVLELVLGTLQAMQARAAEKHPAVRALEGCRQDAAVAAHGSCWTTVLRKLLLTLRLLLLRNQANQLVAAGQFSMLLRFVNDEHSSYQAIQAVNELLGNSVVLEDKVNKEEIDTFVGMLRSVPLNVKALQVLAQLCECDGAAVESNQQLLVEHLLLGEGGFVDASIGHCDATVSAAFHGTATKAATEAADGALTGAPPPKRTTLAGNLVSGARGILQTPVNGAKGILQLGAAAAAAASAAAAAAGKAVGNAVNRRGSAPADALAGGEQEPSEETVSAEDLFVREQSTPGVLVAITPMPGAKLQLLFPPRAALPEHGHGTPICSPLRKIAAVSQAGTLDIRQCSATQREFLTAQLLVLAALCADRFYVAISLLKRVFPYDHISEQITLSSAHMSLRSAFVRLITTLYVDCEPQVAPVGSHLTFLWSQVQQPGDVRLPPPADETNAVRFRSLQRLIARELQALPMNSFTTHILDLLSKLLDFSFYNVEMGVLQSAVDALVGAVSEQLAVSAIEGEASNKRWKFLVKAVDGTKLVAAKALAAAPGEKTASGVRKLLRRGFSFRSPSSRALRDTAPSLPVSRRCAMWRERFGDCRWRAWQRAGDTILDRRWVLKKLEGIRAMTLVLALVFAAVLVTALGLKGPKVVVFEYITFGLFATELLVRMWAVGSARTFFCDPFSMCDLLVVLIDLTVLVGDGLLGDSVGGNAKIFRSIRMMRLFRALRLVKLAMHISSELRKPRLGAHWALPEKFEHSPKPKLQSLTAILGVLLRINDVVAKHRFATLLASLKLMHADALVEKEKESSRARITLRRGGGSSSRNGTSKVTPDGGKSPARAGRGNTFVSIKPRRAWGAAETPTPLSSPSGRPCASSASRKPQPGSKFANELSYSHKLVKAQQVAGRGGRPVWQGQGDAAAVDALRALEQHAVDKATDTLRAEAALKEEKEVAAEAATEKAREKALRKAEVLGRRVGAQSPPSSLSPSAGEAPKTPPRRKLEFPDARRRSVMDRVQFGRKSNGDVTGGGGGRAAGLFSTLRSKMDREPTYKANKRLHQQELLDSACATAAAIARAGIHAYLPVDSFQECVLTETEISIGGDSGSLSVLLFNMMMFEWTPLVNNAIELMMQHFERAANMFERMSQFQLLHKTHDELLHARVAAEIKEVYHLVEQYEVWEHMETDSDLACAQRVNSILDHMSEGEWGGTRGACCCCCCCCCCCVCCPALTAQNVDAQC